MIKQKFEKVCRETWLLLMISISGLLMTQVAIAESTTPANAVPPPPGPYSLPSGTPVPHFRPDTGLENAPRVMPPAMPADFSGRNGQGSLTRQQFNDRQEAHRKQLDQYYQQREAEMNKRVEAMQKRMDTMPQQPAPDCMPVPEDVQQRWEQQKAEQEQRWEQQKAEQEKYMQQIRTEHEKRVARMKAQQDQRIQAQSQYQPPGENRTQPSQPPRVLAPQPSAPAYRYPPRGYGYGYPPPQYGYGWPARGYSQPPVPVAGVHHPAR